MPRRHPVNKRDLEVTHVRGSGPGGQNRNKRWSGVRITHLPTGITVIATERRSQSQNMAAALERLEKRLIQAAARPKKRVATSATPGSQRRRIEGKKQRADTKKQRQKPHALD